jgi:hypothetical protein
METAVGSGHQRVHAVRSQQDAVHNQHMMADSLFAYHCNSGFSSPKQPSRKRLQHDGDKEGQDWISSERKAETQTVTMFMASDAKTRPPT